MYTLSPLKSIKGSNYGEFLKDKNVLLCTRLYKYAPNFESLLTQQYACIMCTLWSDNTCVFTHHFKSFMATTMTWLTATKYLCHKWPQICSTCCKHSPVLTSFMSYHGFVTRSNTAEFTPGFLWGPCCSIFSSLCSVSPFVLFLVSIVLSPS
jgi:hypothetical protein